jgi:hypothetical protein
MLHACFYTICLLFRYTSWHFYAFSGTNRLTSCHSVSSLFSAVFVFQKWYTGNILKIVRNKFLKSYFVRQLPEIRREVGGGHRGPTHQAGAARAWATPPWCEATWLHHWHRPFAYKDPPTEKNLSTRSIFHNTSRSVFHSYRSNECSLFLELRLAFVFCLDFCLDLVISLHQGVFWPLVHVGIHQKSCFKNVRMVLEKRKSFMQKSGTKRSLCRLWPRLLHVVLDVLLIVCLVVLL